MRNHYFFCEDCKKTLGLVSTKPKVGGGYCCSCYRSAELFAFETGIALRAGNDFIKRTRMDYIRLLTTEGVLRKFGNVMKEPFKPVAHLRYQHDLNRLCSGKPGNLAFLGGSAFDSLVLRDLSVGLAHLKWTKTVPPSQYSIFSQILAAKIRKDPCSPFILWMHTK